VVFSAPEPAIMLPLAGKVAFITGSTSGIGLGIARALAAAGADVALNGFGDATAIAALSLSIAKEIGVRVRYHAADMTKPEEIAASISFVESELGSLDVLVNNAGIQHTARVEDFPPEKWNAILAINLSSAFFTAHHALPAMRRRGWGRIVNVASTHGLVASPMKSAYVAAKHGLVGLTAVIALETAGSGITANAICPGWVLTPLVEKQVEALAAEQSISLEEAKLRLLAAKQPSLRFVTTEEIGAAAVFLCSESAASITGTSLAIDGGWTAQ
jgi:3-hydroxybutyrate dehydrogenase